MNYVPLYACAFDGSNYKQYRSHVALKKIKLLNHSNEMYVIWQITLILHKITSALGLKDQHS